MRWWLAGVVAAAVLSLSVSLIGCVRTQFMSLDAWLLTTDKVRKKKNLSDAYASDSTDMAFRINELVCIQNSRRSNDYNHEESGDLAQVCLCACWVGELGSSINVLPPPPTCTCWLGRPSPVPVHQTLPGRWACFLVGV